MSKKYAEQCNYWKTGKSSPDMWMEKVIDLIENFGGVIVSSGFGNDQKKAAYMIQFNLDGEQYRIIWPVLASERGDSFSARRQAVTMLYHDVKAKCVSSQVLGFRTAFFSWLVLPDGRTAFQLNGSELIENTPQFLIGDIQGKEDSQKDE